jgi:hypothetical protein
VIVFDSQVRFFAAHRGSSRVDIFDQDGQCLPRGNRSAGQAESGPKSNDTLYATDSESAEHRARTRTIPAAKLACVSVT